MSLLVALVLLLPESAPEISTEERGSALYKQCMAVERKLDGANLAPIDFELSWQCIQYVAGFKDALVTSPNFCPANGASLGTMIRVYLRYMKEHPTDMDSYRSVGLYAALSTTYPCVKK